MFSGFPGIRNLEPGGYSWAFLSVSVKPQKLSAVMKAERMDFGILRWWAWMCRYVPIATSAIAAAFPQDPSPREIDLMFNERGLVFSSRADAMYGM